MNQDTQWQELPQEPMPVQAFDSSSSQLDQFHERERQREREEEEERERERLERRERQEHQARQEQPRAAGARPVWMSILFGARGNTSKVRKAEAGADAQASASRPSQMQSGWGQPIQAPQPKRARRRMGSFRLLLVCMACAAAAGAAWWAYSQANSGQISGQIEHAVSSAFHEARAKLFPGKPTLHAAESVEGADAPQADTAETSQQASSVLPPATEAEPAPEPMGDAPIEAPAEQTASGTGSGTDSGTAPGAEDLGQADGALTTPVSPASPVEVSAALPAANPPGDLEERMQYLEAELRATRALLAQLQLSHAAGLSRPVSQSASTSATSSATATSRRVNRPAAVRTPKPALKEAAAAPAEPAPQYNGRVLSVDLWDGKPSVVMVTGDPQDKRTVILQPGDSINGVTLREASVSERSASFDVGGGKTVRLTAGEER